MTDLQTASLQTPFNQATAVVRPDWIDNNGHMNVGYYHVVFDIAAEPFFEWLGLTREFRVAHGSSTFALESHLNFMREVKEGDPLRFEARLLDFDHKRIHFYQEMFHGTEGYLAATYESLSVHVDMSQRRTAPMPEVLSARLGQVLKAHAPLARPWQVGHVISAHPKR
jgi:acyl-CoA thioester hydrolase